MNEQENCSDYRPKKSKRTWRTIPSKQEVKEDLVKTQKKGIFITEEAMKRNHKNSLLPVSYPMRIAVSPGTVHQVFLNFRGDQLRYNFVSHVSDGLQRHEVNYFIDKKEPRGNDLNHIFVRIEESNIDFCKNSLAIFSTRYTESSFCLDELVKMKERVDQGKLRVIPIIYKVKAEDVRKLTLDSEFGKNFWTLAQKSNDGDKIKAWMGALKCISENMGLSLREKSSESDFVYEIVMRVKEAIELEEKKKSFWGNKLKRKVGNLYIESDIFLSSHSSTSSS